MVSTALVKIWGETVGAVSWLEKGYAAFEYAPHWVKRGIELAPITMPLSKAGTVFTFPKHSVLRWNMHDLTGFSGLPGLLADSLPERFGQRVLHLESSINGLKLANPVEALLYTGKKGPGALEYYPNHPQVTSIPVTISAMAVSVEQILSATNQTILGVDTNLEALKKALEIGSSAGGARAKVLVAINNKTGEIRRHDALLNPVSEPNSEADFDHWIIKMDGLANRFYGYQAGYCQLEFAWYQMAKAAGIEISDCRLLPDGEKRHFMTRRFDRVGPNRKLHYQSLHALAHFNFKEPYQFGYEDLFLVMRQLNMPHSAFEQQFRRMVFNIAASVADDHTKNFGFLLHPLKNVWELAPAFDLTFTYGLHTLCLNGKNLDFTRKDLKVIADNYHISGWEKILDEVCAVVSNAADYMRTNEVPEGTAQFVLGQVGRAIRFLK